MPKFNDITMNSIAGEPVKFSSFKGEVCLIVNVASQ
jgi:glutathione peroxidase-family protein